MDTSLDWLNLNGKSATVQFKDEFTRNKDVRIFVATETLIWAEHEGQTLVIPWASIVFLSLEGEPKK